MVLKKKTHVICLSIGKLCVAGPEKPAGTLCEILGSRWWAILCRGSVRDGRRVERKETVLEGIGGFVQSGVLLRIAK
jgi:hypothetical protein